MGNTQSGLLQQQLEGAPVKASQQLDTSIQGSTKSWATMDHTISGPWSFLVKEEVQCLCEGGKNCSHENPARQQAPNAIAGLHSSWVGDQVLAMARPWQENVLKHDVVGQFKQHNIGMILNLQEVGEHDSCGPGNLAVSGFTYNPETFMAARIGVYNISWRDMGVPTLEKMMDIVQIMQYTTLVECRKVAVHCHAGLGRTGLAIACFLVASGQACSAARAVEMVRAARPGSLQTQTQVVFVSIFEQYLQHLRCLFKVADLKHLSLGNTNYIVTKVCRRISRSMSGQHQASATGTPDVLAAAAAALAPLHFTPTGSGGSSAPGSATAATAAAAAAAQGQQPDWTTATYDLMTPAEAAQLQSGSTTASEAAANAALNLGPAAAAGGAAGAAGAGSQEGLVMHARRLSGGGAMKLVSNLKAIEEEGDKPVHVIQTDNAVTEVYGHGLTIIRATDSVKKMCVQLYATPASAKPAAPQLPTPHELGLDRQLPWTDKFAIRPDAFRAEGWLPEPPASYLEALKRQQRLLHGAERRRCLHQHKLLRSAAKALSAAAEVYKSVPAHTDATQALSTTSAAPASPPFKRMHSRSRSNAAAIDLLAIAGGLSPCGSGVPLGERPRSASAGGSLQHAGSAGLGAAGSPGSNNLFSKQQQQLLSLGGSQSPTAAAASAGDAGPNSAAALLPGLQLGPPGTTSPFASASGGANSAGGARKLSHQASSGKKRNPASNPAGAAAAAIAGGFFLSSDGSSSPAAAAAAAGPAGSPAPSCTPCLAGCCAPSFAVGLLIALLYKGRFPEEYEAQWAGCPRLKALGLEEGHAVCQALQDVKLAVNAGSYSQLESASGAVAVCVLADWFEGFKDEAFSESTLELLVDDAEALLAEALAAAAASRAQDDQQQLQQTQEAARNSSLGPSSSGSSPPAAPRQATAAAPSGDGCAAAAASVQAADDAAALARKAAARAVCSALAPYEQDLCLLLAAVLRHARHASLDDPRLQELGLNYSTSGSGPSGSGRLSGRLSGGGGAPSSSGNSGSGNSGQATAAAAGAAAAVEAQVDAAMAVLYRLVAGWLLGPLALACVPALEAVAAFLHYLTVDDTAYACLLQAIQQGVRRARSAPAGKDGPWDSLDACGGAGTSAPSSPRIQQQQQQNLDRLEKLKSRLLGAGASFKLKPLSAYYKQTKHAAAAAAGGGAGGHGASVKFADAPAVLGGPQGGGFPAAAAGGAGDNGSSGMGSAHGGAGGGAAAAAQHGIGKSKLRHVSSSPELCSQQQQQEPPQPGAFHAAAGAKHAKSKLGVAVPPTHADGGSCGQRQQQVGQQLSGGQAGVPAGVAGGPSPEPEASCAPGSWTSRLTSKLRSKSSKKHQQPSTQEAPEDARQQAPQPATGPGNADAPHQQQQQQQHGHHHQQQQLLSSPGSAASSSCGDSMSEVIHPGNCQGLCVGQQGPEHRVGHMAEELAVLTGQSAAGMPGEASSREEGPGALDSPPRSVSPELISPTSAARRHAGRTHSSGGSSRQQQQHPHLRLPPMWAPGLQRSSLEVGSDAGSSFTGSPCSSMGSITGFILSAQQHQGYTLQQAGPRPANGAAGAAASTAPERPSSSSRGGAEVSAAGGGGGITGGLAVQASSAVSVSGLSELQLQSSASRVSAAADAQRVAV